ncbi:hypothetical protein NEMIN01_0231 [Nematocida minor]|uniref:uncharacterized protein n=1 Tax=Nematocida minor TaxID=1912983 RepID=UPI002220C33E|nr:uncharacterized protein NEMIN01_0231 [Nematocida minor]KAI5188967.1 hypothetical protein NEMIN01_0231 [Nematocida minor]
MKVDEAVKCIEFSEEFTLDKAALSNIETVEIDSEEELRAISAALFKNFWGLPKMQRQEEWAQFVLDAIETRKDSDAFLQHFLQCIKEKWAHIDIRLKDKFVLLVQRIANKIIQNSEVSIEQFISKGPEAAYDLPLMHAYIDSKTALSNEDCVYLLEYLIAHADTYFTNFFISKILPKFEEAGIPKPLAKRAYAEGNKEEVSPKMRELLYSIYSCRVN